MFQFTNTILINSVKDANGLDKFVGVAEDAPNKVPGSFKVLRVNKFLKPNVVSVRKHASVAPVIGQVSIKMVSKGIGFYRIDLYGRLSGNQNSSYANDFVFKGRPFAECAFEVKNAGATGAEIAALALKSFNKIKAMYSEKLIDAKVVGDTITFYAMDEYLNFTTAVCSLYDANSINGAYVPTDMVTTFVKAKEGFGTYKTLLKNLRLPTMEARRFAALNQEELPVPGATYAQYELVYLVDRGTMGSDVMGHQVSSKTTHVFIVQEGAVETAFAAALTTSGIPVTA